MKQSGLKDIVRCALKLRQPVGFEGAGILPDALEKVVKLGKDVKNEQEWMGLYAEVLEKTFVVVLLSSKEQMFAQCAVFEIVPYENPYAAGMMMAKHRWIGCVPFSEVRDGNV